MSSPQTNPSSRWEPTVPAIRSRAMSAMLELMVYLGVAAGVAVVEFAVMSANWGPLSSFNGFPLSAWWIALVTMSIWSSWHWAAGQTLVGSYLDHYVANDAGHVPPFTTMATRQFIRFSLLYALALLGVLRGDSIILVGLVFVAIAAFVVVFDGRAPWDVIANTTLTQSLANETSLIATPLKSVEDLKLSPQRVAEDNRARRFLFLTGLSSVVVSALIVWSLAVEAFSFVSSPDFSWALLTDIGWFPRRNKFDLSTLVVGTLWITGIAVVVAGPVGLGVAFYLSEYAKPRVREIIKPVIETLASIPSVVLGLFAIAFISPSILAPIGGAFGVDVGIFSILSAGIGVGILTIPIIASIAEDAMRAVPLQLREASYGLGARRATTCLRVVFPAALSGISAAFIVGISRAIGETMVVFLAAGSSGGAIFQTDPTEPGQTITAAMASLGAGTDSVAGSGIAFQSLYFLGALLFLLTLALNTASDLIVRRFRQVY